MVLDSIKIRLFPFRSVEQRAASESASQTCRHLETTPLTTSDIQFKLKAGGGALRTIATLSIDVLFIYI